MTALTDEQLERVLDQARGEVFRDKKNASFLGSVMCSLDFKWDDDGSVTKTAATDGKFLWWHKGDFIRCDFNEKKCTLLHEIWHPARLHFVRGIGKDPDTWNKACDYRINNDMILDGYNLPNNGFWLFDPDIDKNGILSEEQIYDKLIKKEIKLPKNYKGEGKDLIPAPTDQNKQIAMVVRAVQAAKAAGKPGSIPGGLEQLLDKFLNPVVPWRSVLAQFMTDLTTEDYTWSKRNRRYPHIYMPSLEMIPEGLESLAFFLDTSGSITDPAIERMNSELKYIWDVLKPKKLTIIQFDTKIHNVKVLNEGDDYTELKVYGRGDTSMVEVREWIEKYNPTAAIIFSDMECAPMERPSRNIPILWAVIPGGSAQLPDYGKVIHVTE